VATLDAKGVAGPPTTGVFQKEPANAPVPQQPTDGAELAFPADPALFVWRPLAGAKTYEIEIDDDANFVGAVTRATDITSYTLTEPQTAGEYFWRVRGKSDGLNSQWSPTRSYQATWPASPKLLEPADASVPTLEDVVLRWAPVPGAAKYRLQVSPNETFANNISLDVTVTGTQFSPINSAAANTLQNGNYYWRVQALDARATAGTGPWSSTDPETGLPRRFQRAWLDQPQLVAPTSGSEVAEPTMRWKPIDHASHYELQLSTDPNFSVTTSPVNPRVCYTNQTSYTPYSLVTNENGTTPPFPGTTACAFDPAPGITYYWRVRGIDAPATPSILGVFSQPRSFAYVPTVPATELAPSSRDHAPVLSWSPVPGYSRYQVTVLRSTGAVARTEETASTTYTPTVLLTAGTYTWYVQTKDAAGRLGPVPDTRGSFTVATPTAFSPTPDVLPTASGSSAPSLAWQPVEGATKYNVRIHRPGSTLVTSLTTEQRHAAYTPLGVLESGQWEWHVLATLPSGAVVPSATSGSFTIDPLAPVTRYTGDAVTCGTATCSLGQTPELTWEGVPGAGLYRVYVANDPQFTNRVRVYRTQFTSLTPRESFLDSQAGEALHWFVRPCLTDAACGPLEGELDRRQTFRKQSVPVRLQSPLDAATVSDADVRFSWEDYRTTNGSTWDQSARSYRLQVATARSFAAGTVVDEVTVDQTSYAPFSKTYPEGPLFWRVQALDGSSNALTFSEARALTKSSGAPKVLAPTASKVDRVPFFRWEPMPFAARYDIEVYKNGDLAFSPTNKLAAGSATTMLTAWSPLQALGGQGDYAWRLRRVDVDGRKGEWGPGRVFRLESGGPELLSPAAGSGSDGRDLVYDWAPVAGASSYRFQSSTSATFTTGLQQQVTAMTEWAPTAPLGPGTHYWRVQVLDARGNVLASSPSSEAEQAARTLLVCGAGGADSDGDGLADVCDDVIDLHNKNELYPFVKTVMVSGISTGCTSTRHYCPSDPVSRGQMAVFLLRAAEGADYQPPNVPSSFKDVSAGFQAPFIEEMKRRGITTGCTADSYCPTSPVTREQMAVFLLRAVEGSGYTPAKAQGVFTDVAVGSRFADHIEELSRRQVTGGCTTTQYCPTASVTRRQMAAFLVRAFNIPRVV
jgi:hypothetical protein